jgi:hypothetical protein
MSSITTTPSPGLQRWQEARARHPGSRNGAYTAPSLGLMLTGAAVIGLGALAWWKFGSDLKRYIKISRM